MLLLFTGSQDGTSDLLVSKLGNNVFRFNYDLYKDYKFQFQADYWEIENPAGHKINSEVVKTAFWWKAFNFPLNNEDKFIVEEVKYIFREVYHWCRLKGITRGNSHDFHNHLGKINLLNIASNYFEIPNTLTTFRLAGLEKMKGLDLVAKSFTSSLTSTNSSLMTTEVKQDLLHPEYPWYLQEKIVSDADITIFVCKDKLFAYERDRKELKGLDWRTEQAFDINVKEWKKFDLSKDEIKATKQFCQHINVEWGRLDLMREDSGLVFLEYNANGQWVFLDYADEDGLLDAVTEYIKN